MLRATQTLFELKSTPETQKSKAEQPTQQNQMARIPAAVFQGILAPMIELKEVKNIVPASKAQALLFSNDQLRSRMKENEKIHRLFQQVTRGKQAEVKAMLDAAKNRGPEELTKLLITKHTISDHAKRQFDNITLFQLTLWYLDRHMWRMLLTYFKDETMREALQGEAHRQYQEHQSGQTQYVKEHGQYYQFEGKESGQEGIVTALQVHHDYSNKPELNKTDEQWAAAYRKKWQAGVGGAQSRAPLHVIQEYCREDGESFSNRLPEGRFKEENLPRAVNFYTFTDNSMMSFWEGLTSGHITSYGIYRGTCPNARGGKMHVEPGAAGGAGADLAALRRLCQVRIKEYKALELELKKDCQALVHPAPETASPESSLSLSL